MIFNALDRADLDFSYLSVAPLVAKNPPCRLKSGMRIDFPNHPNSHWQYRPWWLFWRPQFRRRHWRWIVDHRGCECVYYWQYSDYPSIENSPRDQDDIPSSAVAA